MLYLFLKYFLCFFFLHSSQKRALPITGCPHSSHSLTIRMTFIGDLRDCECLLSFKYSCHFLSPELMFELLKIQFIKPTLYHQSIINIYQYFNIIILICEPKKNNSVGLHWLAKVCWFRQFYLPSITILSNLFK